MNTVHTYNEFSSQAVILCLIPIWLGICYRGVALSTLSGGDSGHLCLLFSGDDGCRSMVDAACIPLRCATGEVKTYTQTHAGAVEEFLLMQKKNAIFQPKPGHQLLLRFFIGPATRRHICLLNIKESLCNSVPASDFLMPAFSWIGGLDLAWKRSKYADEISRQRVCNADIYGLCDTGWLPNGLLVHNSE